MLTITGSETSGNISTITMIDENPTIIDDVRRAILMDQNNTIQEKQAEIYSLKNVISKLKIHLENNNIKEAKKILKDLDI
jgi:flagellin-specific chaperone FliS